MIQSEKLKAHAKRLRLYNIANRMDSILHHAQEEKPTYPEFLSLVLGTEVEMKERKDYERRLVAARLPRKHDLDEYDYNFYEGIDRRQMKELRELVWLREAYNLILM
ncbi:ATP-binding protein, partial [Phocaeicola vulgatus]|nr:ATP-binding protein [Phocaeicola vulgatus]